MNNIQTVELIMNEFASRTGLVDLRESQNRYLWTDAFAVCNFLKLYCQTKDESYKDKALLLIDSVHSVLGYYHDEDSREGWISGLDNGEQHPTIGGLRIGKKLPERSPDEEYNDKRERDSDGQYFHYLTKWVHALNQAAKVTEDVKYFHWALELAKTAQKAFTYKAAGRTKKMYWKMSIDLSRPLVPSMGQHDALSAYLTYLQLSTTALKFGENAELFKEIKEASDIGGLMPLETEDSLGLGGLLSDASATAELICIYGLPLEKLLLSLLDAANKGIERFLRIGTLEYPAEYRLAFRELGLSIGLHGVEMIQDLLDTRADKFNQNEDIYKALLRLEKYLPLVEAIEKFWMVPKHQQSETWSENGDINSVMLATSLAQERCSYVNYFG